MVFLLNCEWEQPVLTDILFHEIKGTGSMEIIPWAMIEEPEYILKQKGW